MTQPFVSLVMPCFNERAHIEACLAGALEQDYPADRFEVLVADGQSTDGTRALLDAAALREPRVRVVDNRERLQAAGMNVALEQARGDVIVRMDVHCEYASDYVRRCVEVLERTGADNVGGAQRTKATTWFQRALSNALASPLGMGGADYRAAANEGFVDTVFLGAFQRRVFETVGMYDARAFTNEDAELNQRILDSGGKVYLSREIVVHYFPRDSFVALAKQYFKYGKGRARTLMKHGRFASLRPAVPFMTVMTGATLLAVPSLHGIAAMASAVYVAGTGLEAVRVGRKSGPWAIPIVWAIFPVMHVAHGTGFALGLVQYALAPDWSPPTVLSKRPAGSHTDAHPTSEVRSSPSGSPSPSPLSPPAPSPQA